MNPYQGPALGGVSPRLAARADGNSDFRDLKMVSFNDAVKWQIPSQPSFDICPSISRFTIRVRMSTRGTQSNATVLTRQSSGGVVDWDFGFYNGATTKPTLRVNGNAASVQATGTALSNDVQYLIEANYDASLGSNNLKIFIDGVLDNQANYSTAISNSNGQIDIGAKVDNSLAIQRATFYEIEFAPNIVRNYANYTIPSIITPDSYTAMYYRGSFFTAR